MSVGTVDQVAELDRLYVMNTYNRQPLVLDRGEGVYVWDTDGKRYMDWVAGIAVDVLGHSHPAWVQAVREQAGKLAHTSNHYVTRPMAELARELVEITGMDKVFYCNTGAEANEAAIKIARKWGRGKRGDECYRIITFDKSFHGRTFGGMSATAQEKYQKPFLPMVPGFLHLPFDDIEAVRAALDGTVCAVMLETIQGEGGVRPASKEFLHELRQVCDDREVLLVLDEVQCGMGRTGKWMAYEHSGVVPDIVPLAKALGGGFPIGACLARGEAATTIQPGEHGSTYAGGPLATSAALAVIRTIREEGLIENASVIGEFMQSELRAMCSEFPALDHVRGIGLMIGVELKQPIAREIVKKALPKCLLLNATSETVLRIVPPLIIDRKQALEGLAILRNVLAES